MKKALLITIAISILVSLCGCNGAKIQELENKVKSLEESYASLESEKEDALDRAESEKQLREAAESELQVYKESEEAVKEVLETGVTVTMVGKENRETPNILIYPYDQIEVVFVVANNTKKEIKGIQGKVSYFDIFGSELVSELKCDFAEEDIPEGKSVKFTRYMDINKNDYGYVRLWDLPFENVIAKYEIMKVVFADGTEAIYE